MKFKIPLFFYHLIVTLAITFFEIYFIQNIFGQANNKLTSPYTIGFAFGILLMVLTYLIVQNRLTTLVTFLPSILGGILLIVVIILYIWKTQYFDGSGYFFMCAFLAPFVILSTLWSYLGYLVKRLQDGKRQQQPVQNTDKS